MSLDKDVEVLKLHFKVLNRIIFSVVGKIRDAVTYILHSKTIKVNVEVK